MNQVAQWDRQNRAKREKRDRKAQDGDGTATKRVGGGVGSDGPKYRDRAKERRKEEDGVPAESLEAIAARLDTEQTKFLGGDVEHTHLVRGLDYALLRKIRDGEGRGAENNLDAAAEDAEEKRRAANIAAFAPATETVTVLGANLKALLLSANTRFVALAPSSASLSGAGRGANASASVFAHLAFEYDVDPESEQDIPTLISQAGGRHAAAGRADSSDRALTSVCVVSAAMATRLAALFSGKSAGGKGTKRKRNKEEVDAVSRAGKLPAQQPAAAASAPSRALVDDDDIFEGAGKYVPVGALEDHERAALAEAAAEAAAVAEAAAAVEGAAPTTAKGIFSASSSSSSAANARQRAATAQHTALTFDDDDDEDGGGEGAGKGSSATTTATVAAAAPDLMAPVRALLNAHAPKTATAPDAAVSDQALRTNAEGKVVAFRDILGTASASAAGQARRGDAMVGAGKGSYDDIYPETGDYSGGLNDDSDDEEEGSRPRGKAGGGSGGVSVSGSVSGSGSGTKSNVAGGDAAKPVAKAPSASIRRGVPNRAARRAGGK